MDMVEYKKVLLVKVDTSKNVVEALTKSRALRIFLGVYKQWGLQPWTNDCVLLWPLVCKENKKWENVWYVLYSLHDDFFHGIL